MIYYILGYECLHIMVMPIHVYLCLYCISIAFQECMNKKNPFRLNYVFKQTKIKPYACSPFIKKPEVAKDDNDDT